MSTHPESEVEQVVEQTVEIEAVVADAHALELLDETRSKRWKTG